MWVHNINPVLLTLGPLQIRYYGLIYAIGFIIGFYLIRYLAKKEGIKWVDNQFLDKFFLWLIIGTVVGARVFEVLVYNPIFYFHYPLDIFMVWKGGLSFHGGFIGATITSVWFLRKQKKSWQDILLLADLVSIPLAFGLFLGRIGNFINGELWGTITNVPWCVYFKGVQGCRHPTQLYESAKNLLIFFILFGLRTKTSKKFKNGTFFALFIILYSFLRFLIEFVKQPELQLGYYLGLTTGQYLSIIFFVFGLIFLIKLKTK